jgi:hypothetical protein
MYQYETSPFSSINPSLSNPFQSSFQNPLFQTGSPLQNPAQQYQSAVGQTSPFRYSAAAAGQGISPYQSVQTGMQQEYPGVGRQGPFLSPEEFAGSLGRTGETRATTLGATDAIFITELSRCAKGLQDVSEQLEGKEQDVQRKGLYAATAHLFYSFGLLSSKGVFIPGDLPGKVRPETGGVANACREYGRQLDRFVDKLASGRGIIEELSSLVERGKICYAEITRGIEGTESAEQQTRKKIA